MKKGRITVGVSHFFILVLLLAFLAISPQTAAAQEKKPITIGHLHPLTGGFAMFGTACQVGIDMAIDEINKAGGVLGRPLAAIHRDDKMSPEVGLREAKDLVLNKKVDFLTGTISSGVALAISSYAKEAKVVFVVTGSRSTQITEDKGHRYVFRIGANEFSRVSTVAQLAAQKWGEKAKKLVMINPDYGYGHACANYFKEEYGKLVPKVEVLYSDWPKLGAADFTPYISKLMSSNADIVFHSLYGGDYLTFVKQAVPAGVYKKFHVVGASCGGTETVCEMKKNDPAPIGEILSDEFPYWEIKNPKAKEVAGRFMAKAGTTYASYESILGYTTVYALKAAIEGAKEVNTEKVIDYLEGREIESPIGKVKIQAFDHQSLWPPFAGTMAFTADHPWPHIVDIWYPQPVEKAYHSRDYVEKLRKK
jgi:branched-chain amino acid transport system substrate-binding protein